MKRLFFIVSLCVFICYSSYGRTPDKDYLTVLDTYNFYTTGGESTYADIIIRVGGIKYGFLYSAIYFQETKDDDLYYCLSTVPENIIVDGIFKDLLDGIVDKNTPFDGEVWRKILKYCQKSKRKDEK